MYKLYRKSSPRTGKNFDTRLVNAKNLKLHLSRGWSETPPQIDPQRAVAKPAPAELKQFISPKKLSDEIKAEIHKAEGTHRELADQYNVSTYTVYRIKAGKIK